MKRTCLCHAKARKKILIPTITALLITAQLSPIAIAGMSDTEMMNCLSGLPKTVVVAEASTTAEKNSAELHEKYGVTKANGVTSDYKYGKRTSVVTKEITYHKTLEGLENNKELREALKEMLGISSYLPVNHVEGNTDGTAIPMSYIISSNFFNVKDLLSTNSGRKQLAQLGEKYTDWIDADWAEAADLTVMAAFGVVNDDYNLIKYNKNTRTDKISREAFWALLYRSCNLNTTDSQYDNSDSYAKERLEKNVGSNYKYAPYIHEVNHRMMGVTTDINDALYMNNTKKFYQSDIPYLEAMIYIGGYLCENYRDNIPEEKVQKDLIKNFGNITKNTFTSTETDLSKHKISEADAWNLWAAWKAGILKPNKNGNLKWTGTITYKQAVQLTMKALINDSKDFADRSDVASKVLYTSKNVTTSGTSDKKKQTTLINYN